MECMNILKTILTGSSRRDGKPLDFAAIGDMTTDAFITLKDASVNCDVDHHNCKLCVRFGDKVPYESVEVVRAVGNSANAAVSAARLGLTSTLISDAGVDENGDECVKVLEAEGIVHTDFIRRHKGMITNYHYVLCYDAERTILIKHQNYPYALPEGMAAAAPRWVYFSSVGEQSIPYHEEITKWLQDNPESKLAFQPGTFQLKLGTQKLAGLYARTEVFVCNLEESQLLLGMPDERDVKKLLAGIRAFGPKIVAITDGPKGAYVDDGTEQLFVPQYPDPKPPVQRTGAGDAFASTFVSMLALGMSVRDAFLRAPISSMSVVQHVGAQKGLLTRDQIEEWLKKAPADYVVKNI